MAKISRDGDGFPVVDLTVAEARYCETVGHLRYCENLGRANSYNLTRDGRDETVIGAYGEYVVSLFLDRSWQAVVDNPWTQLEGDVGELQVRTTRNRKDPRLILHPRDPDDATFILVRRLDAFSLRIEGWLPGAEGKQEQWWGDLRALNRPAFFVPAEHLYHPDSVPNERNLTTR